MNKIYFPLKKLFGIILLLYISLPAMAHHIIGGEMYYTYIEKSSKGYTYKITMKLYRGCEPVDKSHSSLDPYIRLTIFNNDNQEYALSPKVYMSQKDSLTNNFHDPCIKNAPSSCYKIGYYTYKVTLPLNKKGYTVAYQRCCRNDLLLNANTKGNVGATYFSKIPGIDSGIPGDSGPRFDKEEAILLCSKGNVDYTFQTTDPDGDELKYDFAPGYVGGSKENLAPAPTSKPPFTEFHYYPGFSGEHPLGPGVFIDSKTGRIHGRTNLQPGTYDVTIRVRSYRNGRLIATHLRDFQFKVNDCKRVVLADIPPFYKKCTNNTIQFSNNSTPNKSYVWDFGDGNTSTQFEPTHTFRDTGTYHVWIKVNPHTNCGDSMESIVKIYPQLKPDFVISGKCVQSPIQFLDKSQTTYGNINSYQWDFSQNQNPNSSDQKNPKQKFTEGGDYDIRLTVTNDLGCEQSISKNLQLYDPPDLKVSADTMLCYKDAFQFAASSNRTGNYLWTTNYNINNQNIPNPKVHPQVDTTYRLIFTDMYGCTNTDAVHFDVKRQINVQAGLDTIICAGDPVHLHAQSDGTYQFIWFNSQNQQVAKGRNATPKSMQDETYKVVAHLGNCAATDKINVKAVPYPNTMIRPSDTAICYGDKIQLRGSGGAFYKWSPSNGLSQTSGQTITASPDTTTTYMLAVSDTLGCPKTVKKEAKISVVPPVKAYAGRDTIITTGQTFQLHGSGGDAYRWSPSSGLSNPNIANPIVNRKKDISYQLTAIDKPVGCVGFDTIRIRYIQGPEIYIPSAFTPNGDGQNDISRPIPVGVTKILYFRIYDRWGNLVYKTTDYMKGWNGMYKGKPATQGAYVWMVKAIDFNGNTIQKKGTVLLIR